MPGNAVQRYERAAVLAVAAVDAPVVVTSAWIDEQLSATYERVGIRPGLLADVAGIVERRWWEPTTSFVDAAAMAGEAALTQAGIDRSRVGMMISTSVCRDYLEPSVACGVHDRLGLSSACINFDVANACLGFVNAMHLAGTALEAGQFEYVLIVDGEGSRYTQERTLERLRQPDATAADVFAEFASLTLGSGAAAMVMTTTDRHPEAHRLVGGVSRAATEHHRLCEGTLERMTTDTQGLLNAGIELSEVTWAAVPGDFDWVQGMDRYVMHQVSQVHTAMICSRLGLDPARVPMIFPTRGNVGPAAIPMALASVRHELRRGERVLLMGMGSGLNTSATELLW
jgi:acyl-CoA:acyl-CoA alkyltransferase